MKNLILIIWLTGAITQTVAQDVSSSNLSWRASKMIDAANNVSLDNSSVFKTGPSKVEWIQGKVVDSFTIESKDGSWGNVMRNGRIVFHISDGTDSGSIVIERNSSGIQLTLDISQGGSPRFVRAFTISTVSKIN
jgi:hypothetical protein